jgi:hypothetical protein
MDSVYGYVNHVKFVAKWVGNINCMTTEQQRSVAGTCTLVLEHKNYGMVITFKQSAGNQICYKPQHYCLAGNDGRASLN